MTRGSDCWIVSVRVTPSVVVLGTLMNACRVEGFGGERSRRQLEVGARGVARNNTEGVCTCAGGEG